MMNDRQRGILLNHGTDIDGALYRFGGNEEIYISCLSVFLEDPSIRAFKAAMEARAWDDACAAVHTLKGAAGNMGFVPLMSSAEQMVGMLRADRYREAADAVLQLEHCYNDIADAIRAFPAAAEDDL